MWPKSPRIRSYEQSDDSPRSKKPRTPYNKSSMSSQARGKNYPGQRLLKKRQSFENRQQLTRLPKPMFLTPSSSDHSLSNSVSSSSDSARTVQQPKGKTQAAAAAAPPDAAAAVLPPYLTLKRQQTAAILNFRARKSVSQMDFKEARRTGNYQLVAHVPTNSNAMVSTSRQENQLTIKDDNLAQLLFQDASQLCSSPQAKVRFVVNGDQDVRLASLRVFNTIMLRSWRRRREEVQHLSEQVEDFKRNFVKNRNQLHVYNTLFAVEKRRNDTLNDQLKQSYIDSAKTKLSYNELNLVLDQVNKEKVRLIQENVSKQQEIDNLQELLAATKKELFKANALQREQLEQLTRVQLECQGAKFDIEELTGQLLALKSELSEKQKYVDKLRENIKLVVEQLQQSGTNLVEYKCEMEIHISKLMKHAEELEEELKAKEERVVTLQNCLAATVGQRIRTCLAQGQAYQHATFRLMHFFAYYMFPGTPPPALPLLPTAVKSLRGIFNSNDDELKDIIHGSESSATISKFK
ncbi:uncharacterized protein LOC133841881 [Drosophila sulfurigaster albostrigata]|uniref:uncharacterized protein LOC133841881 n=1 Tax=Drosophila sulfurigaster albostrigata TaxID=89887 RepID=UPI002D21ACCC|nr:uncharacterized protein LOC133841881 [Drosophila sulfurigaster albostrigata]